MSERGKTLSLCSVSSGFTQVANKPRYHLYEWFLVLYITRGFFKPRSKPSSYTSRGLCYPQLVKHRLYRKLASCMYTAACVIRGLFFSYKQPLYFCSKVVASKRTKKVRTTLPFLNSDASDLPSVKVTVNLNTASASVILFDQIRSSPYLVITFIKANGYFFFTLRLSSSF